MIVAIDGPAASGKGTIARLVAERLGLSCLDTGLLYRAVARDMVARGATLESEEQAAAVALALDASTLDDPALRLPGVGESASVVAKHPAVRAALLEFQRAFARRPGGAVLDGRDIGTVVCPDADVKIYVTADVEVRARRRTDELIARGESVDYERVLAIIRNRDARDSGRENAPLRQADDAVVVDTTHLTIDAALAAAMAAIEAARGRRRPA